MAVADGYYKLYKLITDSYLTWLDEQIAAIEKELTSELDMIDVKILEGKLEGFVQARQEYKNTLLK